MKLVFVIPGRPVPKGRPRVVRRGKRSFAFTPKRTREYERLVAMLASLAMPRDWPMLAVYAVTLDVVGARANADIDNVAKAILDGCAPLWADDRQVVSLSVNRRSLALAKADPHVRVEVEVVAVPP